jgi:multidrug efflux system outer membrane protein
LSRKHTYFIYFAVIAQVLTACTVGPNYQRPDANPPSVFRGLGRPSSAESLADLPWWNLFRDSVLQELIRESLTSNFDLRIAISRIEQARAQLTQARAQFFPHLALQGGASRQAGPELISVGGSAAAVGIVGPRTEANNFTVGGTAAWELDLWGRIRRETETANALLHASQETKRAVVQGLVSQVAENYFSLRELDLELEIARRNRDAFGEIVDIFKKQKVGGIASNLEISRATALQAQVAADVPSIERQIAQTENALSLLLGQNPAAVRRGAALTEQYTPPKVPAGLPSALLERRPDIRQAEQQLIAANAQVGVAQAGFLPTLDLTTALGVISPQLHLLTAGGGNFWNVGGGLTAPLFQGGQLLGRYRETKAMRDQARLQYQQTVQSAFSDVANALVSRRTYAETSEQDAREVAALRDAVKLARERYTAGVSTYIELLDAQQLLYSAELNLARTRLQQMMSFVQLYTALGGGWNEHDR